MSDFYGRVLVEPTTVEHERGQLATAIAQVRDSAEKHQIKDLVIAVERTGKYHLPIVRAFRAAEWQRGKFDVRIVHPFATKQHRQPANPGDKTDDHDLAALFRATVGGYGLLEESWDDIHRQLQLLARYRRDLVDKRTALCCQLREHLDQFLPGFAALFDDLWKSPVAFALIERFSSSAEIHQCGLRGLIAHLQKQKVGVQERTLERIIAWAANAAASDEHATVYRRLTLAFYDDWKRKSLEIKGLEQELAQLLARTPYLLLLACPGINVVSAAELAGEMGPINHYAQASHIIGRAGLYRSRYQSDEVDLKNGPLVRTGNRRLRAALMMIADNLVVCNSHYRGLSNLWESKDQDPRYIRTKVAVKFARLLFQLVAGRQVLRHPSMQGRDQILDKLMEFHKNHHTTPELMLQNLQQAITQLPAAAHAEEAASLQAQLAKSRAARRGLKPLADVIPLVLARLGIGTLQSDGETREPS
jgi:transposase